LSVGDFLVFALGTGIAQHPDIQIPTDIYLCAHFTRADIPAFEDFGSHEGRKLLNLSSVRNTFVSINKNVPINIICSKTAETIPLKVCVRDTMHLAPQGKKSVHELGKMLGFPKIDLGIEVKRNMKCFRQWDWFSFREYAIRDAEVCVRYAKDIIRAFDQETGKFKLPVTLTSIGVELLKQNWKSRDWDPITLVGREKHEEKRWDKRRNRYQVVKSTPFIRKIFWNIDFVTESYHGGRNEQYWFGPAPEGFWNDYDLTSAYPTAMAMIGMPKWNELRHIQDLEELLSYLPTDLAFAAVDYEFPEEVRFPVLPERSENGIIFPRKGTSTAAISEILLAHKLKAKLKLVEGVYVPTDKSVRVFEDFIKDCLDRRAKEPKGSVKNLFWKELSNSTYGKTAQGLRTRRIFDLRSMDTKPLGESEITNPFYASFITAFCRGTLGEIMNNLPKNVTVFSVTTDGFLTDATEKQIEKSTRGVLCRNYKIVRKRLSKDNPSIYETKHKVRQPIGWRTRGQATLIPAQPGDWNDQSGLDEDNNYVLAKGGIKLRDILVKDEQNTEIVKMFLNRSPTDEMEMEIGMGIRDMWVYGNDFVDRTLTRRLSMEFDWKRRPVEIGERKICVDGKYYSHVWFTTKPWDSLHDFLTIREVWDKFNREDRRCLKSKSDYDEFAVYVDAHTSLPDEGSKYLRTKDADIARLRLEICRAWRHRKAGTHRIRGGIVLPDGKKTFPDMGKIKHQFMADILKECGIPCKIKDLENAKNKDFRPNYVPRTDRTIQALSDLKNYCFPKLRIGEILARPGTLNFSSE
jgi:hypothetical protein